MKEIWKPIKWVEDYYEISNLGRVKSLEREIQCSWWIRIWKERILKQQFSAWLLIVKLYVKDLNIINSNFSIWRKVYSHFIWEINNDEVIQTKDWNNNNLIFTNLYKMKLVNKIKKNFNEWKCNTEKVKQRCKKVWKINSKIVNQYNKEWK